MRTIAELDEIEFAKQIYAISEEIAEPLAKLKITEILRTKAPVTEGMTPEEKKAAATNQGKENLKKAFKVMLNDMPEETMKIVHLLIIPDQDEKLTGAQLMLGATKLLQSKEVVDFLSILTQSALLNTSK